LTALESVNARDVPGGTAVNQVKAAHAVAELNLAELKGWLEERQSEWIAVMTRESRGPSA
jgi:hypothetical protein